MPPYVVLEKSVGETPLHALEAYRAGSGAGRSIPMTYAGRLDPMASGKLLILIGDECKRRETYDALDKEYEFEVLLGVSSDTGDILGIAELGVEAKIEENAIAKVSRSLVGAHTLPYPSFSSKHVGGKPLFQHALEKTNVDKPERKMYVARIRRVGTRTLSNAEVLQDIRRRLSLLRLTPHPKRYGDDFRKPEIEARWTTLMSTPMTYTVIRCRVIVRTGTYIRSLAALIGERLGTTALAYSIHRTKIGRYYSLGSHFGFWSKQY